MQTFLDAGGFLWLGAAVWLLSGFFLLRQRSKTKAMLSGIKDVELPNADQILMELNERIDRAKALAEGQKARLVAEGWNETIAEQMAANFLVTALSEQNCTHESR